MRRVITAAMVLVLVGCGPSDRRSANGVEWHQPPGVQALTEAERALVLAAWEHHRTTWARDNGRPAPYVAVVEFWVGRTIVKPGEAPGADGITYLPERRVALATGNSLEVPAAVHELHHVEVVDQAHADPRWAQWDAEGRASVRALLAARP